MRSTLVIIGIILSVTVTGQNYTRDAGARISTQFSATFRQFTDENQALEVMLNFGRKGMSIALLKEYFQPVFGHISDNLTFHYGYGAHLGFRYTDQYRVLGRNYVYDEKRGTPLLGINGIIGIEYRFPDFPFLMSLDYKPYFEYATLPIFNLYLNTVGLSLKYRF